MSDTPVSDFISTLTSTLQYSPFYAPWYRIVLGDSNRPDMVLCTDDPTNNYVVSFENKKNGSGLCNSFTLVIAWRPQVNEDINKIDKILSKVGLEADMTQFSLQYGYSMPHTALRSPIYNGLLTKYTVEIRDGFLVYSMNGYSSIVALNNKIITIQLDEESVNLSPTQVVQNVFNKVMDDTDNQFKYEFSDPDNVVGSDQVVDLQLLGLSKSRTTLIEWVNSVLASAVDKTQDDTTDARDKFTYTYEIDDTEKKFIIRKVSAAAGNPSAELVPTIFDWMDCSPQSKHFNLIKDFRPDFDGSVLMSYDAERESSTPTYGIKSDGSITTTPVESSNNLQVGDQLASDAAWREQKWMDLIREYPYKATLSTIGIPTEIPLLTEFQIRPLIHNQEHHTAGTYAVLSSYDRLDSSGLMTNFELFKLREEVNK